MKKKKKKMSVLYVSYFEYIFNHGGSLVGYFNKLGLLLYSMLV